MFNNTVRESYLTSLVQDLPMSLRERVREEIDDHIEELADQERANGSDSGTALASACKRMGDPQLLADAYLRADARTPFFTDGTCLKSLGAVIGAMVAVSGGILALLFLNSLFLNIAAINTLGFWTGLLRAFAGAFIGPAAYFLYLRWGGNPLRIKPFITASFLAILFLLPLRLDLNVQPDQAASRWTATAYFDLPTHSEQGWVLRSGALHLNGDGFSFPQGESFSITSSSLSPETGIAFFAVLISAAFGCGGILERRKKEIEYC